MLQLYCQLDQCNKDGQKTLVGAEVQKAEAERKERVQESPKADGLLVELKLRPAVKPYCCPTLPSSTLSCPQPAVCFHLCHCDEKSTIHVAEL